MLCIWLFSAALRFCGDSCPVPKTDSFLYMLTWSPLGPVAPSLVTWPLGDLVCFSVCLAKYIQGVSFILCTRSSPEIQEASLSCEEEEEVRSILWPVAEDQRTFRLCSRDSFKRLLWYCCSGQRWSGLFWDDTWGSTSDSLKSLHWLWSTSIFTQVSIQYLYD